MAVAGVISVLDAGYATGNDVVDDSPGFQQAMVDCANTRGGVLLIPPPPVRYRFATTCAPRPAGTQHWFHVVAAYAWDRLRWDGANSTAMFDFRGLQDARIEGLHAGVFQAKSGVIAYEISDDGTRTSIGRLNLLNCRASFASGATNGIGYRFGHYGTTDVSGINLYECPVVSDNAAGGHIGYVSENQNVAALNIVGGGGTNLAKMVSNRPTAGAASALGGSHIYCRGMRGTGNLLEFDFYGDGVYVIDDGLFRNGQQLLYADAGNALSQEIRMQSIEARAFTPTGGRLIALGYPGGGVATQFRLVDSKLTPAAGLFDANMITVLNGGASRGSVVLRGNAIRGVDPCWTINGGDWVVDVDPSNVRLDATNQVSGRFGGAAYAPSNDTTRRAFDVNDVSLGELASVLGTYLRDERAKGRVL
jgi:hypothetical protein